MLHNRKQPQSTSPACPSCSLLSSQENSLLRCPALWTPPLECLCYKQIDRRTEEVSCTRPPLCQFIHTSDLRPRTPMHYLLPFSETRFVRGCAGPLRYSTLLTNNFSTYTPYSNSWMTNLGLECYKENSTFRFIVRYASGKLVCEKPMELCKHGIVSMEM